uniref:Ciliary neurotrophic factor n=1 Tax=Gouania willdenowi TaxID=441366 RepID=A0A8C5D842_GOUWI
MNGHVKNMPFQLFLEATTTFISLSLLMAVDSTKTVAVRRNQACGNALQQTLKITKLLQKESIDLTNIYKASQGEISELFCTGVVNDIPDPNIIGLETSERLQDAYMKLQAFFPHFARVYEQQTDLQPPSSPLLSALTRVSIRSRDLAFPMRSFYQNLFPNLPPLEPEVGSTELPPPQNVFQQKVYGCVVLKTYKEFLSNVSRELRTMKGKVCVRYTRGKTYIYDI